MPTPDNPGLRTTIGNEFAEVSVERVMTRNGMRLRIRSSRDGASVDLCPLQLEALAGTSQAWLDDLVSRHTSRGEDNEPIGDE